MSDTASQAPRVDPFVKILLDHSTKLSALEVVLLFALVEVHRKTPADISSVLALATQGLDPARDLHKGVQSFVDDFVRYLDAMDRR